MRERKVGVVCLFAPWLTGVVFPSKVVSSRGGDFFLALLVLLFSVGQVNALGTRMKTKTVFLVRHAESMENEKLGSLKEFFKGDFAWAKLSHGVSILQEPNLVDTTLSTKGKEQVETLRQMMAEREFLKEEKVELVIHSPLIRAKETCDGVLASDTSRKYKTVVEEVIREKYIREWVPGLASGLDDRIQAWEQKLAGFAKETDGAILVVGHSQFWKRMLKMDYKFDNCDVWKVEFQYQDQARVEENGDDENECGAVRWHNPTRVLQVVV